MTTLASEIEFTAGLRLTSSKHTYPQEAIFHGRNIQSEDLIKINCLLFLKILRLFLEATLKDPNGPTFIHLPHIPNIKYGLTVTIIWMKQYIINLIPGYLKWSWQWLKGEV